VSRASFVTAPWARLSSATTGVTALVVTSLIVLMACLNVMNLLLARAPVRQRSLRVRLSLGASRGRIVSQLLVESVLLALLGCGAGLLVGYWLPQALIPALPIDGAPLQLTPDLRVIAWALSVSLTAAAVFGVAPALEATRIDLATAIRGDAGVVRGNAGARLRQAVVAIQLAGSLMLLLAAALLVRGILHARATDPGFDVARVHAFRPNLAQLRYHAESGTVLLNQLRTRVAALPGVASVAFAAHLPLGPRSLAPFSHIGEGDTGESTQRAEYNTVSAGWFETMGVSIVRGRGFTAADERAEGDVAAVIGEAMARRFWPDADALGRRFRCGAVTYHVVGIARDARSLDLAEPDAQFFYEAAQLRTAPLPAGDSTRPPGFALLVRSTADVPPIQQIMQVARSLDPGLVLAVRSLQDVYDAELVPSRRIALFAGLFGVLATILALVGVYGAVAYAVSQRTREIGLRIALGAAQRDILMLVMRQGIAPLVVGVTGGLLLAAVVSLLSRRMLFGLPPLDPLVFAGTTALLTAAALVAMLRPARRAAAVDPMRSLRHE
jgi:predicted permease